MEETEEKPKVVTETEEQNGTAASEPESEGAAAEETATTTSAGSASLSSAAAHWATAGLRLRARKYRRARCKAAFNLIETARAQHFPAQSSLSNVILQD